MQTTRFSNVHFNFHERSEFTSILTSILTSETSVFPFQKKRQQLFHRYLLVAAGDFGAGLPTAVVPEVREGEGGRDGLAAADGEGVGRGEGLLAKAAEVVVLPRQVGRRRR